MSADVLRRAAALMRDTYSREEVDDISEAEFYLAVADWLDEAADFLAAYRGETHAMDNPLAVARAYLGESA